VRAAGQAPPRLQKEYRRQDLIQAAFRQIAQRGFEGLRTREVAAEAGVNIATLHYYFPTKEALIRGVIGHAMGRFRSTLAPHGNPNDQLVNHMRAVRSLMRKEPEIGVVMGELALRSARDPSLAKLMRSTNDGWHQTLRGLLRRAVREANVSPHLDSDEAAALIMVTLMSLGLPSIPAARADQAFRELERWMVGSLPKPRIRSSK
jgi:AcrR family transcriptional regulator